MSSARAIDAAGWALDEDDDKRNDETRRRPSAFEIEEAADWLLRLREAPDDAGLQRAFRAWLDRSPLHKAAFRRAERAWALIGSVPPAFHPFPQEDGGHPGEPLRRLAPRSDLGRRRPSRRRMALILVGATAATFAAWALLPGLFLSISADHATGTGEISAVTLPDGSQVVLGAGSAIDVDLRRDLRSVVLLSGEAYFDVASDAARPFVVDVGDLRIAVISTRFDVALTHEQARIDLESGMIDVSDAETRRPNATMAAGERLVLDRTSETLTRSAIDAADVGAWRRGQLFVENATIASVVETIRRYHPAFVVMPDPVLAERRVTGLYDLGDPDRALSALVEPHGGHVRPLSPYLRILTRF